MTLPVKHGVELAAFADDRRRGFITYVCSHLRMRRPPYPAVIGDVVHQFLEYRHPRTVANNVWMHGELEQAPLGVRAVELVTPDRQHAAWWRVRPQRRVAVHWKVDRIVADPLHRNLDDSSRLSVRQHFIGLVVRQQ